MSLPEPVDPGEGGGGGGGGGGVPNPPGVYGTPIFDLQFNKHEAASVLECMAFCNLTSNDDLQLTAYLWVDGVLNQYATINMILDTQNSHAQFPLTIPMFATGLAAGARHIQLTIRNLEPDSPLYVNIGATLKITEIKNAAR